MAVVMKWRGRFAPAGWSRESDPRICGCGAAADSVVGSHLGDDENASADDDEVARTGMCPGGGKGIRHGGIGFAFEPGSTGMEGELLFGQSAGDAGAGKVVGRIAGQEGQDAV